MHNNSFEAKRIQILILSTVQFGYNPSSFYYCKYGRNQFDITYQGFAGVRPTVDMEGAHIKPIPYNGNKLRRLLRLLWQAWRECRQPYDIIFIRYFPGCSIIRLLTPGKQFVLDIRTGSIHASRFHRWCADMFLFFESKVFPNITVISESLANKLGLCIEDVHYLPLGADVLATNEKTFDGLHLLYVGTLSGREIEKTIQGFGLFYQKHKNEVPLSYTIVGDGYHGELKRLKDLVFSLGLTNAVNLLGYVRHEDLAAYWENCNLGVSYIPMNNIYDAQPPTKTFEYLLAGMPVIATATTENRRVISPINGVIINDTAVDFCRGLEQIFNTRDRFNSTYIRYSVSKYQWNKIVSEIFIPYIVGISSQK